MRRNARITLGSGIRSRLAAMIAAFCLLLIPAHARAQGGPDASWAAKKEKVNALITMRLTQELALNPSQSAQIGQILKKNHERRNELRKQVKGLTAQLRSATASGNEAEIKKLLAETKQAKSNLDQAANQMFDEVKPLLTPKQQAQFLIAMDEIRSEIRAIKHREKGPGFPGAFTNNPNAFPGAGNPNDPLPVQRAIQP